MAEDSNSTVERLGIVCRAAASAVIAGVWRKRDLRQVNAWIAARPMRDQVFIVGGVFLVLFLLSLIAAQFGLIGMAVYFFAVILIAR